MNQIEAICNKLDRPVTVISAVNAPQHWRVQVRPQHRKLRRGGLGALTQPKHLRHVADSIALGLGVSHVEIEQDAHGLWLIVPKPQPDMVHLRHLRFSPNGFDIPIVLGVGVTGQPIVLDLGNPTTPHLLVAGATGSGKTVLLKAILTMLCCRFTPDELMTLIIDTKQELAVFCQLGHNVAVDYGGVITDPHEATLALGWALKEARRRYKRHYVEPAIVIVIDEWADIVLSEPQAQLALVRVAQMVRTANIHIILSTQRPSVDVVTGLVKANMPARVALALPSRYDSRTILDRNGAEKLLGRGDALLLCGSALTRFQVAYVGDEEIEQLIYGG